MPKLVIDGTVNGVNVKVIIKSKQWFAKPNNHTNGSCGNCPHFHDFHGVLEVHEDSADGFRYREMYPEMVCSGSYSSGSTWVQNNGKELALLPMDRSANGFTLDTTASGSNITLSADAYCLMAIGRFGDWKPKTPKAAGAAGSRDPLPTR